MILYEANGVIARTVESNIVCRDLCIKLIVKMGRYVVCFPNALWHGVNCRILHTNPRHTLRNEHFDEDIFTLNNDYIYEEVGCHKFNINSRYWLEAVLVSNHLTRLQSWGLVWLT